YLNSNALRPGTYRVEQPASPSGYLDGKLSSNGVVLQPAATRSITVTYDGQTEAVNNNFASLLPGSISGLVYLDANNDAAWQSTEVGVAGVKLTLTGTNDLGAHISQLQFTDDNGAYQFTGLRPGTYVLTQTAPAGLLQGGMNAPGSIGGTV